MPSLRTLKPAFAIERLRIARIIRIARNRDKRCATLHTPEQLQHNSLTKAPMAMLGMHLYPIQYAFCNGCIQLTYSQRDTLPI